MKRLLLRTFWIVFLPFVLMIAGIELVAGHRYHENILCGWIDVLEDI